MEKTPNIFVCQELCDSLNWRYVNGYEYEPVYWAAQELVELRFEVTDVIVMFWVEETQPN